MPRGVAIPEIRYQLFAAAERVILRDGPARLSGRAVTGEAGVATGLLHAHFSDFDAFLVAYAVDRAFLISAEAASLPERAGTGSVAGNLRDLVRAIPPVTVQALTRLFVARPELPDGVRQVLGDKTAGLEAIEGAATAYFAQERRLGRIARSAEPATLALALVGVLHHLVLTTSGLDFPERLTQAVDALLKNLAGQRLGSAR